MSKENGVNKCIENGCMGLCCGDIAFYGINSDELAKITPSTETVIFYNDRFAFQSKLLRITQGRRDVSRWREKETTVRAFANPDGSVNAVIDGPCPNLDLSTFTCTRYNDRPSYCEHTSIGSNECNACRLAGGLPEIVIPLELV